ncbi:MAG: metallophosphoesterase [Bacteroidaceae bacterium]|nr:metallophosphoesterase [Bacteroidaceae bacterium]
MKRKRIITFLAAAMLLLSSCASLSSSGVGRTKHYTIENSKIPADFDNYSIAFISDTHYPSLFSEKRLRKLVSHIKEINPNILLLGGDYVTSNDSIDALFSALSATAPDDGIYAVLGNHERSNSHLIAESMKRHGICLLRDSCANIPGKESNIIIAGIEDSFKNAAIESLPGKGYNPDEFMIVLAHTPDYAERTSATAGIVLSGHTHGGQVSLLGLYTPVKNTIYGRRFLRGENRTTNGTTVITTNGIGTSRKKIRFCVPSEIVVITLKSTRQAKPSKLQPPSKEN